MKTKRLLLKIALFSFVPWLTAQAGTGEPALIHPEFLSILRAGELTGLRQALDHGAPANGQDAEGNTPLMLAAVYGGVDSLQLLIERGADVNANNRAGATPLMRAATDPEKVALLLQHGAEVRTRSRLGNTALMLAARPVNSHRTVAMLLDRGADVNTTNNWGATALMAAAAGGDAESVKLLLQHGAAVNAQPAADHEGFVLGGGRTALMWAAYRGDVAIVKLLIDAGADVNEPGLLGTPLSQAAWAERTAAAQLLVERGAKVNQLGPMDGYSALHWAASTEQSDPTLVKLLLSHGGDPNLGGGENVDAFMGTAQTPLMLARRRGETPVVQALVEGGASKASPDRLPELKKVNRSLSGHLDDGLLREAVKRAMPQLQKSSLESKQAFIHHASHQDCVSCHQQLLPVAATALARQNQVEVDAQAEEQLVKMVRDSDPRFSEANWEALFHPEPVHSLGYTLLAMRAEELPASATTDGSIHHLAAIQGPDGQWFNNLPRPPIQTSDIGATALAVHALQAYPLPGHKAELAEQVKRASQWLWKTPPHNTEERIYQILGLAWAGEPTSKLQTLAQALVAEQRADGGWAQLPHTSSDAYATGQAIYALRIAAGFGRDNPAVDRGLRFLLTNQLEDGTWYVRRRAFPFQPTMESGFPHGRDSWISASATSWAVMALSLPADVKTVAFNR